jgi:IstB-like ATP binding protein
MIAGRWIDQAQNPVIDGPAGIGNNWLACALAIRHAATTARSSISARMFADLALARGDGRYRRLMRGLGGDQAP